MPRAQLAVSTPTACSANHLPALASAFVLAWFLPLSWLRQITKQFHSSQPIDNVSDGPIVEGRTIIERRGAPNNTREIKGGASRRTKPIAQTTGKFFFRRQHN